MIVNTHAKNPISQQLWPAKWQVKRMICSTYADHHIQQFQRRPRSGSQES
jgi:hypothetical protein